MGKCERCGDEFQAYCAKCRMEIKAIESVAALSNNFVILLAFDKDNHVYRYGCSVVDCPCNLGNGWCSKQTPHIDKEFLEAMLNMIHEFDGDNCIKQWCG